MNLYVSIIYTPGLLGSIFALFIFKYIGILEQFYYLAQAEASFWGQNRLIAYHISGCFLVDLYVLYYNCTAIEIPST